MPPEPAAANENILQSGHRTYNKTHRELWYGCVDLHISEPYTCKDRYRTCIAAEDIVSNTRLPLGPNQRDRLLIDDTDLVMLEAKTKNQISALTQNLFSPLALQHIRDGIPSVDNFSVYAELKDDSLHKKWLSDYDSNWKDWLETLEPLFGQESLTRFTDSRCEQLMETLTNKRTGKHALTEKSRRLYAIMDDLLDLAEQDGLLTRSEAVHANAQKNKQSTKGTLLRQMAVTTLTIDEQQQTLRFCLQQMRDPACEDFAPYAALTLALLLGLTPHEVCGLNSSDIKNDNGLQYIDIRRRYYQERRQSPEIQELLNSAFEYRCVPLTDWVARILAEISKRSPCAADCEALFQCHGRRLAQLRRTCAAA